MFANNHGNGKANVNGNNNNDYNNKLLPPQIVLNSSHFPCVYVELSL